MKATVLDGISRELGHVSTRRSVLRLLGGVAAVGGVAVVSRGETAAKRKKKTCKRVRCAAGTRCVKGKCIPDGTTPQDAVCRPGTLVAQLNVGGNGAIVSTPVLTQGQAYTFQASGVAALSNVFSFDAEFVFANADPSTGVDVANNIDVGLSIDDPTVDNDTSPTWGAYNPNHVYETRFIGKGAPAQLRMHDGDYTDNSGSVLVTITCA